MTALPVVSATLTTRTVREVQDWGEPWRPLDFGVLSWMELA